MNYICYLVNFRDKNGNTSSDLCRAKGAFGMTTGSLEEARVYGQHILKNESPDIVAYIIWQLVEEHSDIS